MKPMRCAGAVCLFLLGVLPLAGQELEPAAYAVSPVGVNVIVVGNNLRGGDVTFAPSLPVEEASATINTTTMSYLRSFDFLGRSANAGAVVPFSTGHIEGKLLGELAEADRTGFGDPAVRFGVNLFGAPAMNLEEFSRYRQSTIIGVSVIAIAPLGQYDSSKLINIGTNRWSFKPEVGLSKVIGNWTLEVYAGVWLFTDNNDFVNGGKREQAPIGSTQVHILYRFKPRLWLAANANFYTGGRTKVNGDLNLDLQKNSRIGGTMSIPLNMRNSLKLAYSVGAYTTIGADFRAVLVGWQYAWGPGM